jgi:hypothetical protein
MGEELLGGSQQHRPPARVPDQQLQRFPYGKVIIHDVDERGEVVHGADPDRMRLRGQIASIGRARGASGIPHGCFSSQ